jgi:hypothetical protein
MEFLEAPPFTRHVYGYLTDDGYQELQNRLAAAPEHGDVNLRNPPVPGIASFDRSKTWQRTKSRSSSERNFRPYA